MREIKKIVYIEVNLSYLHMMINMSNKYLLCEVHREGEVRGDHSQRGGIRKRGGISHVALHE